MAEAAAKSSDIVSHDAIATINPKPLIRDILRTQFCTPGSVFLVEHVDTLSAAESRRWRVVRLLLGDGELCIQALLGPAAHRFIDTQEIVAGSYVRLERFDLQRGPVHRKHDRKCGEDARPRRTAMGRGDGEEMCVFLVVWDISSVGWNTAVRMGDHGMAGALRSATQDGPMGRLDGEPDPNISLDVSDKRKRALKAAPGTRDGADTNSMHLAKPAAMLKDWKHAHQPLRLTNLAAIPNLPYKQNWSVNVLAIIVSVSPLEKSPYPPYVQRTARLSDPSTSKEVLLTVFLDPEDFCPVIGIPILLAGVKNHVYDGGCLKKYASDRPVGGLSWWYQDMEQVPWCDSRDLESWWRAKIQ